MMVEQDKATMLEEQMQMAIDHTIISKLSSAVTLTTTREETSSSIITNSVAVSSSIAGMHSSSSVAISSLDPAASHLGVILSLAADHLLVGAMVEDVAVAAAAAVVAEAIVAAAAVDTAAADIKNLIAYRINI